LRPCAKGCCFVARMPEPSNTPISNVRLKGVTFAKQFPNPAEPVRGTFVLRQVLATSYAVQWRVIAPVLWAPAGFRRLLRRPRVPAEETRSGIQVAHPAFWVGPHHVRYSRAGISMAAAARAAFAGAVKEGAEFVHVHALFPSGEASRRLAGEFGIPYVVTVHGSDLYTMLQSSVWSDIARTVAREACAVVCVSERLAQDSISRLGVDPSTVVVIPDAYDEETFHFVERPSGPSTSGGIRLACVGRLEPPKGQDVLVEALGLPASRGVEARLALVGSGSLEPQLRRRASELGIADRVDFLGALPPERVAEVLAAADIYVQPSRREGFGVALVEAMATGLPAVATRSGGPDGIVGEADGVLVAPDDPEALAAGLAQAIERRTQFDRLAIAARMAR